MSLNVFYYSPISRRTVSIQLKNNENINHLYDNISSKESIDVKSFKLYSNGKRLESTNHLKNDSIICLHFGLNGGKGGFGSMLRAIGAQIEKTTNREACRDLTGRRLRDINEEKRIKEWIKKEKSRKDQMEEKRRQKLSKLAQKPSTHFNDLDFERTRSEIPDIVDEALQYGLQLQQRAEQSTTAPKRKSEEQLGAKNNPKKKRIKFWSDIDIEDDSESDDSDVHTIDTTNTEEQITEDSLVSNDNTNDSEVTNNSKIIGNQSNESVLEKQEEYNEVIVRQNDKQICESISKETGISVTKETSESISEILTETKDKESTSSSYDNKHIEQVLEPLNLMHFQTLQQLETLGLDRLKHALMALGLKCGGSLSERANRLWSIRGLDLKDIPKKLFAKKR